MKFDPSVPFHGAPFGPRWIQVPDNHVAQVEMADGSVVEYGPHEGLGHQMPAGGRLLSVAPQV